MKLLNVLMPFYTVNEVIH